MGGEGTENLQPGGRPSAPDELGLVQAFINTHYDLVDEHGAEVLATPEALSRWLADHELAASGARLTDSDLDRMLDVREALRELARGGADSSALAPLHAAVQMRLMPAGPRFQPLATDGVDAAIAALLAIVAREMLSGRWSRLKICPGHDCGWAFYDGSRNRTGRWCSMSVCGGRAKARAHYRRRRELA